MACLPLTFHLKLYPSLIVCPIKCYRCHDLSLYLKILNRMCPKNQFITNPSQLPGSHEWFILLTLFVRGCIRAIITTSWTKVLTDFVLFLNKYRSQVSSFKMLGLVSFKRLDTKAQKSPTSKWKIEKSRIASLKPIGKETH